MNVIRTSEWNDFIAKIRSLRDFTKICGKLRIGAGMSGLKESKEFVERHCLRTSGKIPSIERVEITNV